MVPSERWELLKIGSCCRCCLCQAVPGHLLARLPLMTERTSFPSPSLTLFLSSLVTSAAPCQPCPSLHLSTPSFNSGFKSKSLLLCSSFLRWVIISLSTQQFLDITCQLSIVSCFEVDLCADKVPVGGTL